MRESGILMHITSLPSPYGVGTMGKEAYAFVDFLRASGQRYWQILPLTPTGYGDSPYQSCSTFAGNHYLIDLDTLAAQGLLEKADFADIDWGCDPAVTDFGKLYNNRLTVLRKAYARFQGGDAFDKFCIDNSSWLPDFALFMAIKAQQGGKAWYQWEDALKRRDPETVWNTRKELREEIRFYCFVQYLFDAQWQALRRYAHEAGILIIGDVPIYVPYDSVEVWSSPEMFDLDADLNPVNVAGCPPDAFTADGQLWGNPLYRWDVHKADSFSWWVRRMAAAGTRYDVIRLDHFRGFESYWAVPFGDETARGGVWKEGPGMDFVNAMRQNLPELAMIAEDLGFLTQAVLDLRDASGYPGMKVLQFAFDSREPSEYLPHTYVSNSVCYTGTHDNMTTRQYLETLSEDALQYAREYMNLQDAEGLTWGVIRSAMATVSDWCVIPMQDLLDLGGEARMNFPGKPAGNWTWRATPGYLTEELTAKFRRLTALYGRLNATEIGE